MTESALALRPLPRGRHKLSRELVRENQRRRLMTAAAELLSENGYGGITVTAVAKEAGISTGTLYQRFDDLWACLLAAYKAAAAQLCDEIETACAAAGGGKQGGPAGIAAALALLASEPPLVTLLSTEPPSHATALRKARSDLVERLTDLLRGAREHPAVPGEEREARLVGGALALVAMQTRANGAEQLGHLAPTLAAILLGPEVAQPKSSTSRA